MFLSLLLAVVTHTLPFAEVTPDQMDPWEEGLAVELPAGTEFPFTVGFTGDFIEANGITSVTCKRDMFVTVEDELLLSVDGTEWKTFTELCTGSINFGLNSTDEGHGTYFEIVCNERES